MSEGTDQMSAELSDVTLNDFYIKLSERVSAYNAKLLMHSVITCSGLDRDNDTSPLNREDAKTICLELIKKGGPAFQVGKAMYTHLQ